VGAGPAPFVHPLPAVVRLQVLVEVFTCECVAIRSNPRGSTSVGFGKLTPLYTCGLLGRHCTCVLLTPGR
jgi:hypothetical protein